MKKYMEILAVIAVLALTLCIYGCRSSNASSSGESIASAEESTTSVEKTDPSAENTSSEAEISSVQINPFERAEDSTTGSSKTDQEFEETGNKVLVVYFSATGTTEQLAGTIASAVGANLVKITPVEIYTDADLDYNDNNSRTTIEQNNKSIRPKIANTIENFDKYSIVFVGFPIWWNEEPRIMDTFVESYSFAGKTVIPFCTSGGSGVGTAAANLKGLSDGGSWLEGARMTGSASESEVSSWVGGLLPELGNNRNHGEQ